MRGQNRTGLIGALSAAALVASAVFAIGQVGVESPRLVGPKPPTEPIPAEPLAQPETDLRRQVRSYPEQPPVIPHSIDDYELTLNTNRCLSCHRRQFTEATGAPMISITHFMTRQGQMLADVAPRRYFCTGCHVIQTDARPLVENLFRDMLAPIAPNAE